MALFQCKMCGGSLEIDAGSTVIECSYCGTQQTLPKLDNSKRVSLYERANHFRRNNEFDKATEIFEQILNEDNTDAETYWSLVLCRYGVEYVEDPASHKRIPTVHRAQYTSIFDDDNYKSALYYANISQRLLYEEEAKALNEIQKGILAISQREEPFDVFICYKESDADGRRTQDSVLAQELYYQLTQAGFKTFFARITLEDKIGSAYEPYIFAALNSSKVMVVLGTKPDYFNAVWVKNEWSRYLSLIKQGQKKVLIPAYRDMNPYNLPEEFSHLQAQDMSKLGFMQDLIRGIEKIAKKDEPAKVATVKERVVTASPNSQTAPLLRRAFLFLEDGEFANADEYAERILDINPECAEAYVVKLLVEFKLKKQDQLAFCQTPISTSQHYQKALRFATPEYVKVLEGYDEANRNMFLEASRKKQYNAGITFMGEHKYDKAIECFESAAGYRDSEQQIEECKNALEKLRLAEMLRKAEAQRIEEEKRLAEEARRAEALRIAEENYRLEEEKKAVKKKINKQKNKISLLFVLLSLVPSLGILGVGIIAEVICAAVIPQDASTSILGNAFVNVFAYLIVVAMFSFPLVASYIAMIIPHRVIIIKYCLMIIAYIAAILLVLFCIIGACAGFGDLPSINMGIACVVSAVLNACALIYPIVLKIILTIKMKKSI